MCMGVTCVLVHVQVLIGVGPQPLSCSHHVLCNHLPLTSVCVCVCVCVFVYMCVCVCAHACVCGMNVHSSNDCKVTRTTSMISKVCHEIHSDNITGNKSLYELYFST